MGEKWLTTKEAAALWRVTPWTIRAWVHRGRVMGHKFGPRTMRVLVVTDEGEGKGRGGADGVQGQAEEVRSGEGDGRG